MDRRSCAQCERVRQNLADEEIFRLTGLNLDATHVAPKIRWLADNQKDIYQRSAYFLLPGSYMAYALTGELGVDYSNASSTLLLDVHTRTWSALMAHAFTIDLARMAPLAVATDSLGTLRPTMAERLGLNVDTLV